MNWTKWERFRLSLTEHAKTVKMHRVILVGVVRKRGIQAFLDLTEGKSGDDQQGPSLGQSLNASKGLSGGKVLMGQCLKW